MNASESKVSFGVCVAGWHFFEDVYRALSRIQEIRVYVVSHRSMSEVPVWMTKYVPAERLLFRQNIGYDWGCYEQYYRSGLWRGHAYAAFMHDDLQIRSCALFDECRRLLSDHAVIGNGRPDLPTNFPAVTSESYAHSRWKPASSRVQHDVVRGSFFATTRESLERLGGFEVFWDRFKLTSGYGNWSARASCGKWQAIESDRCFGFLSDTPCDSNHLLEYVRGGVGLRTEPGLRRSLISAFNNRFFARYCKWYMALYWQSDCARRRVLMCVMFPLIALMAGESKTLRTDRDGSSMRKS